MYRALNNRLRRSTDKAREIWYKSKCDEIDQNIKEGKSGIAYRLAKEVTGKQKGAKRTQAIMDENGLLQTELVNIKCRWKRYVEQLYAANEKADTSPLEEEHEVPIDALGPLFIYSKIEKAMSTLKKGKSAGVDEVPGELITILDVNSKNELLKLSNMIYKNGHWPDNFTRSNMIPLEKKTNTNKCEEHRTISLISHASKIPLKALCNRLTAKVKAYIGRDQFGFMAGRGTRDAIALLRVISEKLLITVRMYL